MIFHGVNEPGISVQNVGHNIMGLESLARTFKFEQATTCFRVHPFGECWIEQVMRRRYIEATRQLRKELEEQEKKPSWSPAGNFGHGKTLRRMSRIRLRHREDVTVEVHRWIMAIPHGAFKDFGESV